MELELPPPINELVEWTEQRTGSPHATVYGLIPLEYCASYNIRMDDNSGGQYKWTCQREVQRALVLKSIRLGTGLSNQDLRELRHLAQMTRGYADSGLSTSTGDAKRLSELVLKMMNHHENLRSQSNEIKDPFYPLPPRKDSDAPEKAKERDQETTVPEKTSSSEKPASE